MSPPGRFQIPVYWYAPWLFCFDYIDRNGRERIAWGFYA
jgi:hypothetical protein